MKYSIAQASKYILFLLTFLSCHSLLHATNRCLQSNSTNQAVKNLIFNSGLNAQAQRQYLKAACSDYETTDETQIPSKSFTFVYNFSKYTMRGGLFSVFTRLSDYGVEGQYKSQLQKIKNIPNRYTRIRLAYELATKYQGNYDYEQEQNPFKFKKGYFVFTPKAVLNNAVKNGSGGVCRHFAALMQWTLLQVARPPVNYSPRLDTESFKVKSIASLSHVWVRVYLPFKRSNGSIYFDAVDLDPTNYSFAIPLLPKNNLKPDNSKLNECLKLLDCIDDTNEEPN